MGDRCGEFRLNILMGQPRRRSGTTSSREAFYIPPLGTPQTAPPLIHLALDPGILEDSSFCVGAAMRENSREWVRQGEAPHAPGGRQLSEAARSAMMADSPPSVLRAELLNSVPIEGTARDRPAPSPLIAASISRHAARGGASPSCSCSREGVRCGGGTERGEASLKRSPGDPTLEQAWRSSRTS